MCCQGLIESSNIGAGGVCESWGSTQGVIMIGAVGENFQDCWQLRRANCSYFFILSLTKTFLVQFTALVYSDSILKLLKRVYKKVFKSSFLFSCKTLTFLFLPFLNLGAIGMCSQNRYTNLKSALDQPFSLFFIYQFSELNELCKK